MATRRRLSRLYPPSWRDRYGDELDQLVDDLGGSTPVVPDIAMGAARAWLEYLTDYLTHSMVHRRMGALTNVLTSNPGRSAVIGLVVALPTTLLLVVAVLKYIVGIPGPFDAVEPAMTPIVTHPLGETFFVVAPYVGIALALLPVTRFGVARGPGGTRVAMHLEAPIPNLVVAAVCGVVVAAMLLYWVAENL